MRWSHLAPAAADPRWELSAEAIAVTIRWFGLVIGFLIANFGPTPSHRAGLNAILVLGFLFTALDTVFFLRGRVFLRDEPLIISVLEAVFIGMLCLFESGSNSSFRFYYLLSLICCAIRYRPRTTFITCGLDCLSYIAVGFATPRELWSATGFLLTIVMLIWVTGSASAMARLLQQASDELRKLNAELKASSSQLEVRIAERTRELEESQAQVLHQEKMAAFGLLAAGIAHEVGNPLTSISSIVQMLEQRDLDDYTRQKLTLVMSQLARIQTILRELVTFSRPASDLHGRVNVREVVDEALGIAKYYKGGKNRAITVQVPEDLPILHGVRDQLVQVVFNLVLNAIDATGKGGRIEVSARRTEAGLVLSVADDGHGIPPEIRDRLFRPYLTTKRHGTGLGLFVTRRIVQHHGGEVTVRSEANQRTEFEVCLPVPPPDHRSGSSRVPEGT